MATKSKIEVTRLNHGQPIINPTPNWWESGVTFNPAVTYLKRGKTNDNIIRKLLETDDLSDPRVSDGVVVVYYRARPSVEVDPDRPFARSCSGMAVLSPKLEIIHRHKQPIIMPDDNKEHYDYVGVEDGRIHRFNGDFYYLYCGVSHTSNAKSAWPVKAQICLAKSSDLLNWQKCGPVSGNVNTPENNNKDGVFFPEKIDGYYYMLHRPCYGLNYSTYAIALARSKNIEGPWNDLGPIKYAEQNRELAKHTWVGAGAVPISLGNKRFLVIYHKGHILNSGQKWYDLHAAIYNFNMFKLSDPGQIVEKKLEHLLVPRTYHERVSAHKKGVLNVVFTCGCYLYAGELYIVYGGADSCTLAAKVNMQQLLNTIKSNHLKIK